MWIRDTLIGIATVITVWITDCDDTVMIMMIMMMIVIIVKMMTMMMMKTRISWVSYFAA